MSDGMVGHSHVTIPDLLEPVVGFRTFNITGCPAKEAWTEVIPESVKITKSSKVPPAPFVEPNAFVVDPVSGKMIRDYVEVARCFKLWQESMEVHEIRTVIPEKVIQHPAQEYAPYELVSPNKTGHKWQAGANTAQCLASAALWKTVSPDKDWIRERELLHKAPSPDCQCGLYSYYEPRHLYAVGEHIAAGVVTQWGQIEAHSTGMRSEFMKIEVLMGGEAARVIAEQWGIEFVSVEDAANHLNNVLITRSTEYGSPLPVEMRPKDDKYDGGSMDGLRQLVQQGNIYHGHPYQYPTSGYRKPSALDLQRSGHQQQAYYDLMAERKRLEFERRRRSEYEKWIKSPLLKMPDGNGDWSTKFDEDVKKTKTELRLEKARKKHEHKLSMEIQREARKKRRLW